MTPPHLDIFFSARDSASGKPILARSHTSPPGRAEGLFLILDSDRLIVPTQKTLSPKLDRGALPDLLLTHTCRRPCRLPSWLLT